MAWIQRFPLCEQKTSFDHGRAVEERCTRTVLLFPQYHLLLLLWIPYINWFYFTSLTYVQCKPSQLECRKALTAATCKHSYLKSPSSKSHASLAFLMFVKWLLQALFNGDMFALQPWCHTFQGWTACVQCSCTIYLDTAKILYCIRPSACTPAIKACFAQM